MGNWRIWLFGTLGITIVALALPWLSRLPLLNDTWRLACIVRHPVTVAGIVLVLMWELFVLGGIVAAYDVHPRVLWLFLVPPLLLLLWMAGLRLTRFVQARRISN